MSSRCGDVKDDGSDGKALRRRGRWQRRAVASGMATAMKGCGVGTTAKVKDRGNEEGGNGEFDEVMW